MQINFIFALCALVHPLKCSVAPDDCHAFVRSSPKMTTFHPSVSNGPKGYFIQLKGRHQLYNILVEMGFSFTLHAIDADVYKYCISVRFVDTLSTQHNVLHAITLLNTNSEIPVGELMVNATCRLQYGSLMEYCVKSMSLLPAVLSNPLYTSAPLRKFFWTPQRVHESWLDTLAIHVMYGTIPADWVSGLSSTSLRDLLISGNSWGQPMTLLGHLPAVTRIFLPNNSIQALPNDTFQNIPRAQEVDLSMNDITRLPRDMSNVKVLNVSAESPGTLLASDEEVFNWRNMESVILINRRLVVNFSTMMKLPHIKRLVCQGCWYGDQFNSEQVSFGTSTIEELNLSSSNLTSLPSVIFSNLKHLSILVLEDNLLHFCPKDAYKTITNLTVLNLSRNRLTKLYPYCFTGLNNLIKLDLSWNQISIIESTAFSNMIKLVNLYLSHNYLTRIHPTALLQLKNLESLYIAYNQLIEEPTLNKINLDILNLMNNNLTSIKRLTGIRYLDLSGNRISELRFLNVSALNLSYNSLTHIPKNMWEYLITLDRLDLGGNKFSCCDESTPLLQEKIIKFLHIIRNLNTKLPLTCFSRGDSGKFQLHNFTRNGTVCMEDPLSVAVLVGIPLGALSSAVLLLVWAVRYYRSEFAYISYFVKMNTTGLQQDEKISESCLFDAFVSYSDKNLDWIVIHLLPHLERGPDKYRLCLHDRDFVLGVAIEKNITEALQKSRKVIFILSNAFLSNTWCQWELTMANHKMFEEERNYIILIEVEPLNMANVPFNLEYLMDIRTYIQWPKDPRDEQKCVQRLRQALGDSVTSRVSSPQNKSVTREMITNV